MTRSTQASGSEFSRHRESPQNILSVKPDFAEKDFTGQRDFAYSSLSLSESVNVLLRGALCGIGKHFPGNSPRRQWAKRSTGNRPQAPRGLNSRTLRGQYASYRKKARSGQSP